MTAYHGGPHAVLALDIGGTKIAAAVVRFDPQPAPATAPGREEWTVLLRRAAPTHAERGGEAVRDTVVETASALAREYRATANAAELTGIAVSSAGVVDERHGSILSATDLIPRWAGTTLGGDLEDAIGLPARVLNDVHAHALGEMSVGAGEGLDSAVVVAVGTGMGGAIVVGGQVLRGAHWVSGNLGHIHHSLARDFTCSCGRVGHIEAVASGSGITSLYNARADGAGLPHVDGGRALQELADGGNVLAQQTFVDAGRALGEVLGSLANATDPEVIILSGSMTRSGDAWWSAVRDGFRASAINPVRETPIVHGTLAGDAPLIGAAVNFLTSTHEN